MPEVWKNIPGFAGWYQVSDLGNVVSVPRAVTQKNGRVRMVPGKRLRLWRGGASPYPSVALWRNKKRQVFRVARLVLLTFRGPPPQPGMQASHEPNPDPNDNRLCNLCWRTHEENMAERDLRAAQERELDAICRREEEGDVDLRACDGEDSQTPF